MVIFLTTSGYKSSISSNPVVELMGFEPTTF
jgi:hypothetical protein